LLINEYLRISSDESVSELTNLPNPTLSVDIPVDINNFYKEYTLDLNIYDRILVFIVYYKKSDDSLNVSFKINNNNSSNSNNNQNEDGEEHHDEKDNNRNKGSYWDVLGSFGNMIASSNNKNGKSKKAAPAASNNIKNLRKENHLNNYNYNNNDYKNNNNNNRNTNNNENGNRKSKDFNLNKLTSFKILSFLSVVSLNDEKSKTQVNTNIVLNNSNKSAYTIYKINNFSKYLDDLINAQSEEINNFRSQSAASKNPYKNKPAKKVNLKAFAGTIDFVNLKINLKLCNIHSAITSYILKYFDKFYFDGSIYKISKQLFLLLIKNRSNKNHNEDHALIALLNWCKNFFLSFLIFKFFLVFYFEKFLNFKITKELPTSSLNKKIK